MRVELVTSPHVRHPAVLMNDFQPEPRAMYTFAPVGLLSLIASARTAGFQDVRLFDLNRNIINETIRLGPDFYGDAAATILASSPDVVGFMTECDSYHHVLQIAQAIKSQRPATSVVLGGPHATAVAHPTMARTPSVDAIVTGEGEVSFVELLRVLSSTRQQVRGVLLRDADGEIVTGGPAALVDSLDELPIPAYETYRADPNEEIFVEVGRGCPFQCTFCSTAPYWGRKHRVKSPQRIVQEVRTVQRLFGAKRVHFTHDLFTTVRAWVEDVCDALIAAGVPMHWTCSARTDTVDDALLAKMASAGCNAIYFGIESGSARVLSDIRKPIPLSHSLDVLRACRRAGISPNAGFIVGFPSDDEQSIAETFAAFEASLDIGTRPTHIFAFCPFAGASIQGSYEAAPGTHFLDFSINAEVDRANRARIAGDGDLFGAYWRPSTAVPPGVIEGADEFSPLVDAVALPSLLLARAGGGMYSLYRMWLEFIEQTNSARGAGAHRRWYGGPNEYCAFLLEYADRIGASAWVVELTRIAQTTLHLAAAARRQPAISMATHRSVIERTATRISLSSRVAPRNVVATMACEYELREWLSADTTDITPPRRAPFYIAWHSTDDGDLRLVEIGGAVFRAMMLAERAPKTAAELYASSEEPDIWTFLESLNNGADAGLLKVTEG